MNAPESGDAARREAPTNGGRGHPTDAGGGAASRSIEVPTYGLDGEPQMVIPVDTDDQGVPPAAATLLGCDTAGRAALRHYARDRDEAGWVYVQTTPTAADFG